MKPNILLISTALLSLFSSQGCTSKDITLIADPKVTAINVVDNNEPLVDIKYKGDIAYGPSPEIPNNTDYTQMRKTVYEKLKQAQTLLPSGLKFCLYEGYRSIDLQQKLFENRYYKVRNIHPTWTHEEIFNETIKLVSPVVNLDGSKNIPPHSTGAAIDVYLVTDNMQPVDMGIHPKDWMEDNDGSISKTDSKVISPTAKHYREIMSKALLAVGFTNYPTEYWHWSYGDRYWAYQNKKELAIYGKVKQHKSIIMPLNH